MKVVLNRSIIEKLSARGIIAYVALSMPGAADMNAAALAKSVKVKEEIYLEGEREVQRLGLVTAAASRKRKTPEVPKFVLPDWIPRDAWDGWEEMRNRIKKPMTDRARAMAVKELKIAKDLGHSPEGVLEKSTMRCWTGLFIPEELGRNGAKKLQATEFKL